MNIVPSFIRQRIAHRPNLLKIVDNIGWLFFDKILRMGVGLFVGVWIARYLGPEQFGLLSFATAFIGLFGAIAGLGLQGIVVRDIVRDPSSARLTLGTAAMLQLIGGLASFLLILGAISILRPDDALARSIVAILGSMTLLKVSEIAVYWFESQVQSKYTVWVQNSVFLIFAVIKVGLILSQATIIVFVWAMLAETVMTALILIIIFQFRGPEISSFQVSINRAKTLLRDSLPMIITSVSIGLYMKIDQVMLGQLVDDNEVGLYSAAAKLTDVWLFIPAVVNLSLRPFFIEKWISKRTLFSEKLELLFGFMTWVPLAICFTVFFQAENIIGVIFGAGYEHAEYILIILIWGSIFVFWENTSWAWYIASNKQSIGANRVIMALLINIILNSIFIPIWGGVGAALATLVSRSFSGLIGHLFNYESRFLFFMILKSPFSLGVKLMVYARLKN